MNENDPPLFVTISRMRINQNAPGFSMKYPSNMTVSENESAFGGHVVIFSSASKLWYCHYGWCVGKIIPHLCSMFVGVTPYNMSARHYTLDTFVREFNAGHVCYCGIISNNKTVLNGLLAYRVVSQEN